MIITRVIDFPDCKAGAMCIMDANGDYNIYLNGKMAAEDRFVAYLHELAHIENNDFEKPDVNEAERRTA